MALIFCDGFDKYGPANSNSTGVAALLTAGEWTSAAASDSIVAPLSATGFALRLLAAASNLSKTLSGAYGRLIGGVRFSSNLGANAGISFLDGASVQASIQFNTTGTFAVRNGIYTSGTVLGTSTASVTANTTHYLEWDFTFANAGSYQLWLDGVSILSGSGDTTTTANNTASVFQVLVASSGVTLIIDDLYLFDTTGTTNNAVLLTSPRIETTFPSADGAVQFAVGAGILGANAARVTTTNAPAAGSLVLRRFTPSVACTLNSIGIMPAATSGTANYRGVVYADSSGAPGTLMSSGTQVTGVTSGTAATLPLTTPQSLSAGTQYWIGFINDTSVTLGQTDGGLLGYRAANTYASGAPGTAPAMTSGQASWQMWGNLSGNANWYSAGQNPPQGSLSYVYDATVGHEDLYVLPNLATTPGTVHAVAIKANVARSDSGAKTVSMRMKSGATDGGGSATGQTPGTSYGWLTSLFATDPNTGAAWLPTNLNAAQVGFKIDS